MNGLLRRLLVGGLAVVAAWALTIDVAAQDKLQPKEGEEAVLGGGVQDNLQGAERSRWTNLQVGKAAVGDDPQVYKEVIAKAARWYAYRLTMPRFHGLGEDVEKGKPAIALSMNNLIQEVSGPLLLSTFRSRRPGQPNANQLEYLKLFTRDLTKCLRDVLSRNSKPIVRVNAARMLALIAETEQEEVADTLIAILRNPRESDGVKFWALRGLRNLFAGGKPDEPLFKDAKREARTILALQEYLARKPAEMPADPMEQEALRYVRREAIRALALSRHATVPASKDAAGRTAWWLAKMARKDGFTPTPNLAEQMEAAIGLCQMKPNKDLQSDYLAYQVGNVVVDFLNHFNRAKLGASETNLAWKLYATRLGIALEELKNQARNAPGKTPAYVDQVVEQIRGALKPLDAKDPNPDATVLDQWLRKHPPASTTVYKSVADSTVQAPEAAEN